MTAQLLSPLSAYTNGQWHCTPGSGFTVASPKDRRKQGERFGRACTEHLDQAAQAASQAESSWARTPALERAKLLAQAGDRLLQQSELLIDLLMNEAGKPQPEALAEVNAAAGFLQGFAAWAAWGEQGTSKQNGTLSVIQHKYPRGTAAIITPWNYPLSNPCQKIAAALIGGNPVIWRPSTLTPAISVKLTEILHEAGLPKGVFNLLLEDGDSISKALVAHPCIQAISFTGSTRVGLLISAAAAARGIAVQCEMGGKNAALVMPDADLDLAAQRIAFGAFGFAGQKCTAVSRLLVHQDVASEFMAKLEAQSRLYHPGHPNERAELIAPLISLTQVQTLSKLVRAAAQRGLTPTQGGEIITHPPYEHGNYFAPTLLPVHCAQDPLWQEECFGPILAIRIVTQLDDAIADINNSRYGLGAAIFSNDLHTIRQFSRDVQAGVIKINDVPPGLYPHISAGGWKLSGAGLNELSEDGVDFFMRKKSIYLI